MTLQKIAIVASDNEVAQRAFRQLTGTYGNASLEDATVIVALGGDGFILEIMHHNIHRKIPIYGMNCGTVGFLLNGYNAENLGERLRHAEKVHLHPLKMRAKTMRGSIIEALAINEVALRRETRQAAKFRVLVDGRERLDELVCDGVMVATPAGSTAYNFSAHGPILPLGSGVLALTPISAFRPRRWRGALLSHHARVTLEILEPDKRPVAAVADYTEVTDVAEVDIHEDRTLTLELLFDPEHNLEERILIEQFRE